VAATLETVATNMGVLTMEQMRLLLPRTHRGCFYCARPHPDGYPEQGNSCPVVYL
jgi:hypothetical protein